LVQGDAFLAHVEIDDPKADGSQQGKQVAADDDDDGGLREGMGDQLVVPLWKIFHVMLAQLALVILVRVHGTQLQDEIAYAVAHDQVKKQYQDIHQRCPFFSKPGEPFNF
jgi:hypothetical protein